RHFERSEKQKRVMKHAAERDRGKTRRQLTGAERLEMCARIARQTEKEFGRWEREERERERTREEMAAAKRRREVEGPVVRVWSGSAIWRGERMEEKRVLHGSKMVEEVEEEATAGAASTSSVAVTAPTLPSIASTIAPASDAARSDGHSLQNPPAWLTGIHDFAAQPATAPQPPHTAPPPQTTPTPSFPPPPPQSYLTWHSNPSPPPPPPPTLLREQAQRTLIILDRFPALDVPAPTKRPPAKPTPTTGLHPTEIAALLLPSTTFPAFTPDELRYLLAKHGAKKRAGAENFPPAPERARCAILSTQVAKYRDPGTGVGYGDLQCYRILRRVVVGGCQWSGVVGAWVGPSATMGRPARGVPEGFAGAGEGVKVEGGA
ncbi:hypothetical protein LTR53_018069, partial [Teratosphaeriaceae sp. CCFEE 6253]